MRDYPFALLFVLASISFSCTTHSSSELYRLEMPDIGVQDFTTQLKKDSYTFDALPELSPEDIDLLLDYATDDSELLNYPINPISSYKGNNIKLGYLVLWTIENIRLNYPYDANEPTTFLFPSKNPLLRKAAGAYNPIDDLDTLIQAAELYRIWWDNYDGENFDEIRVVDPLAEEGLAWF